MNQLTTYLWKATSNHTNIQHDAYNSTKDVLKDFRSGHENKLLNQLTSQGSIFCSVTKFALPQLNKVWSIAQSQLPKNIYNFTIRYINNSLNPTLIKPDGQYLQIQTVLFASALKHY
jgi:hypothetical protein